MTSSYDVLEQAIDRLAAENARLLTAIRKHRDQRADDRCWLDDCELYAVIGDNQKPDNTMPLREEFLANCQRFYDRRCTAGKWPSYQDLEKEIDALRLVHIEARELVGEADSTGTIPLANLNALRSLLWRATRYRAKGNTMPSKEEFLTNCKRFYDRRCTAGKWSSYQELEKEIDTKESEIKKLKDLLRPFADLAVQTDDGVVFVFPDSCPLGVMPDEWSDPSSRKPTLGDCRRARRGLS